jgi:hypothetical protein
MASLPWPTWRRLIVWFIIGIVFYFFHGVRRSNPRSAARLDIHVSGVQNVREEALTCFTDNL